MQVTFEIPDDLANALGADSAQAEARVRSDLAVHYYQCGLLAVGRAAGFAGMSRGDFEKVLSDRSIERPYQASDLVHELNFQA
jgi:predicted HTH domain antitoxin